MGGKSSPPPPDYSGMEGLGREQLAFSKQQYAELAPLARQIAAKQLAAQDQQMQQAKDYYDYQVNTFRPLEQGLVADAARFSTEGYREGLASEAAAAAGRAFGTTQAASQRAMAAMGVNPNSGKAMAMQNQNALGLAAQRAGAMTGTRRQAEQTGWARRMDVTGLGRNLAGASTAAYQAATGAGSAGLNTSMAPGSQYQQGLSSYGNTMGSILNSQTSAYNAGMQQEDPFATIVGTGLGIYARSDIRLKQNIERVGFDERTQLPIYEFEYKDNPGERFRGVMAHEAEVNFPEAVITGPDGYKAVFYERLGMQMVKV